MFLFVRNRVRRFLDKKWMIPTRQCSERIGVGERAFEAMNVHEKVGDDRMRNGMLQYTWIQIPNTGIKQWRVARKHFAIKNIFRRVVMGYFVFYYVKKAILFMKLWNFMKFAKVKNTFERKSGIPESTLIPAPTNATTCFFKLIYEKT